MAPLIFHLIKKDLFRRSLDNFSETGPMEYVKVPV